MIRLARPDIDEADIDAVSRVLRSGHLVQGEHVAAFERAVATRTGVPHVAAVSNGTAALHLALLAIGIDRGDRVAVPTYSWPATANAVVSCGATPVFVDIEPRTMGMDPDALSKALVMDERIRAVIPVHAFGRLALIDALCRVAEHHGLPLIEDAACALGASLDGVNAGGWGVMGTFSFHPRKAATTGEGGAIACRERSALRIVRALRNHGLDPDSPTPDFISAGFNCRMTEFQAALGCTQLEKYDRLLVHRRILARTYDECLAGLPLAVPDPGSPGAHVYQSYVVLLRQGLESERDRLMARMRARGIEVAIGTYHMPLLTYFRKHLGHKVGDHPVGESVAARSLALPMHGALGLDDVKLITGALAEELAR